MQKNTVQNDLCDSVNIPLVKNTETPEGNQPIPKKYNNERRFTNLINAIYCPEKVVVLDLANPGIKFFPNIIGNFKNLKFLSIECTYIESLPDELYNHNSLEYLVLGRSRLNFDVVLERLISLKSLKSLNLFYSRFSNLDSLSHKFCELTQLEELDASFCELTKIPNEIHNLHNLKSLIIGDNPIVEVPNSMKFLENLEYLDIGMSGITNSELSKICKIKSLKTLKVYWTRITEIPPEIENLTNLEELSIYHNKIKVESFKNLNKLYNLKRIVLDSNTKPVLYNDYEREIIQEYLPNCKIIILD